MLNNESEMVPEQRVSCGERVVGQLKDCDGVSVGHVGPIGTVDGIVIRRDDRDRRVADIATDGTHHRVRYWQRGTHQGVEVLDDRVEAANRAVAWLLDDTACCRDCGALYKFSMETLSVYCRRCRRRRMRETIDEMNDEVDG